MRAIDHIVYAVPQLAKAIQAFEHLTGIRPVVGGQHQTRGTHNALVNLGRHRYLEILAVDPTNLQVPAPRWMGVDLIDQPRITRWSLKSTDLARDMRWLKTYDPALATPFEGSRHTPDGQTLRWRMSLPLARPLVEVAPFFTDWQDSTVHPCDRLPDQCELLAIRFGHPDPVRLSSLFQHIRPGTEVEPNTLADILIEIATPRGRVVLQ